MKKTKENKGITLIALVITIIVMLILVAVTVNVTTGDTGLFSKAREAASGTNAASANEMMYANSIESEISNIVGSAGISSGNTAGNTAGSELIESGIYEVSNNGDFLEISGFSNDAQVTDVVDIETPDAVRILSRAFENCITLQTLRIESSFVSIYSYAFSNCTNLNSVNIYSSFNTQIGDNAFENCTSLESITMPANSIVGKNLFDGCTNLTNIYVPFSEGFTPSDWDPDWLGDCTATINYADNSSLNNTVGNNSNNSI